MTGLHAELLVRRSDGFTLDLSLNIEPGETAVLLGPNGAGKSTAVMALAGLVPLAAGRISLGPVVFDDPTTDTFLPPDQRGVGVVFQDYLLFPHLTAAQNVAFGIRERRSRSELAEAWIDRVGLAGLGARRPGDLSGGQAQRVALARALASEPRVLLLDEPLAALDARTRPEVRRTLVRHLEGFAGPRLVITHDPTEAFLLADSVHVIEAGRLTQSGSADDIRLRPRSRYAADLAGTNLLVGTARDGVVDVDGWTLHIADRDVSGPVTASIRPSAITVHLERPSGSPRNVWVTSIDLVEGLGDRIRLRTGAPIPLTVEVTKEAVAALGMARGAEVWVAIKATEIQVDAG